MKPSRAIPATIIVTPEASASAASRTGAFAGATEAAPTIDAAVIAGVLLGPTDSSLQVPSSA